MTVILYDTSLRDGTQGEGVQLSVSDKLKAARLIEELGIQYIEGGWPGSNPRDEAFFEQAKQLKLERAKAKAEEQARLRKEREREKQKAEKAAAQSTASQNPPPAQVAKPAS